MVLVGVRPVDQLVINDRVKQHLVYLVTVGVKVVQGRFLQKVLMGLDMMRSGLDVRQRVGALCLC